MLTNNSLLSLLFKKINGHEAVFSLEITAALLMKFLLLAGIWWFFFAGNKQPVDGAIIADKIFGETRSVAQTQKTQEKPE